MNETSQTPRCSRCGATLDPGALKGLYPRCLIALNLAAPTEMPGEAGPQGPWVVQPPPAPREIAGFFPQLEILECLGRGGMGVVYKARQPRLDRLVALKILAPEKEHDPQFAERFAREAKALARLSHPNIITVHDFGEIDGLYYLIMEFVDGVSLRQLLLAGKMPPEQALGIVPKICDGLQYAHEMGVVHRDIKPENVLLDKQGRVKIADFGIAKIVTAGKPPQALTQDQVVGTPHYMAPEQMERPQAVDHRADIYSLGVVFYEMLTGELPLGKFAPPSQKVQLDVRLDEVVLHALEKEPARRYQQASEVKTAVEKIAGVCLGGQSGGEPPGRPPGAPPPTRSPGGGPWNVTFTGESVRTQFVILAVMWWVGWPFAILSDVLPRPQNVLPAIIYAPALITATAFGCILMYRHWGLLQGQGVRTTPGKAVGFGFIPIFFFYWWFVEYAGLAKDNNRYFDRAGITSARMPFGLAVALCVFSILLTTVGLIRFVGAILDVPVMVLGFIFMLQQRDCVLAILEARQRGTNE